MYRFGQFAQACVLLGTVAALVTDVVTDVAHGSL